MGREKIGRLWGRRSRRTWEVRREMMREIKRMTRMKMGVKRRGYRLYPDFKLHSHVV